MPQLISAHHIRNTPQPATDTSQAADYLLSSTSYFTLSGKIIRKDAQGFLEDIPFNQAEVVIQKNDKDQCINSKLKGFSSEDLRGCSTLEFSVDRFRVIAEYQGKPDNLRESSEFIPCTYHLSIHSSASDHSADHSLRVERKDKVLESNPLLWRGLSNQLINTFKPTVQQHIKNLKEARLPPAAALAVPQGNNQEIKKWLAKMMMAQSPDIKKSITHQLEHLNEVNIASIEKTNEKEFRTQLPNIFPKKHQIYSYLMLSDLTNIAQAVQQAIVAPNPFNSDQTMNDSDISVAETLVHLNGQASPSANYVDNQNKRQKIS